MNKKCEKNKIDVIKFKTKMPVVFYFLIAALLLFLTNNVFSQPVMPTGPFYLESYDMPGWYMTSTNLGTSRPIRLIQGKTPEALWLVAPAFAGTDTISLTPVSQPGNYARHAGWILYTDPSAQADQYFNNDASWHVRAGLADTSDPTLVSFENNQYASNYIQHNTPSGNTPIGFGTGTGLTVPAGEEGRATFRIVLPSTVQATNPQPEDEETDVYQKTSLSWMPGDSADKHVVFLGTDFNDVNEATIANPLSTEMSQELPLDSNSYDPANALEYGKTYYWRVDEVNAPDSPGINKGKVWSFTIETYVLQLPAENITATANNGDPNNTINGSGLDPENPDQHNSTGGAMWVTNGYDPNGTWIRYDFDKLYKLDKMYVWNYNAAFNNKYGIQDVLIQYSADNGQTWTDITSVTQFAKAPAKTGYTYNTVVPFDGAAANSVRITELSNFVSGSKPGDKAGLSEVRFYYIPVRARKPSPATGSTGLSVTDTILKWYPGRDAVTHRVYIDTNEDAVINSTSTAHTVTDRSYMPSSLNLGRTYYWCVNEVNTAETPSVWQSDIWNFSTEEYLTIDDFEDYNDNQFQGYAIFNTWGDGFDSPSTNGALIGNQESTPFCETVIVEHGLQSAPVIYNNSGSASNSEVYRNYSTPQNWSAYGADTLRLYYRGKAVTFQQTSDGLIAMSGGGTDIWNNSDQFRFVYKSLNGNGSITARVDSIENTDPWAKAGVMIRNTLDANSVHAMSISAASGTASFQRRVTKGGASTGTDVTGLGHPYWVKITRSGNTLTAQRSADGINWYSFGADPNAASTETISMNTTVYIGLAVTSHSSGVLAAATFSNISTTGTVTGNWTVANIGDTTQAEGGNTLDSLYVSLTDNANHSKKVFAPSDALGSGSWMEWQIPLSQFTGVTTSQIKKIAIGVGDPSAPLKGKGEFYMDNIGFGHTIED